MPSKFAPARRSPGPPRARQTVRRAGAAVLTCALTAAVAAGCTTFPQPPGGAGAASGSPGPKTPGTPATAGPVPAPTHARDDITHTLPNPNAPASAPADAQHPHAVAAPRIATQYIYRADLPQESSWVAWGQTPLTSWDSDVQPAVRFLRNATGFGATTYPGHDPSMGRAVDIRPTSAANGTRLANWLMANTGPLGIQYIGWSAQIYNIARASDGVRYMADRGSVTQNHQDHVHVSFRTPGPILIGTPVPPWNTYCGCGTYGAIGAKWTALGGTSGFLGNPLDNEYNVAGVAGARVEDFAGGSIYWSAATGAHEVHGAILAKYRAAGNAAHYGLPSTDESTTPDGVGRYNHFTSGRSIYWTPSTGAHLVYGSIRAKWASLGWERGRLRYPTTDEYSVTGGRRNDFQYGSITWSSSTGALTVVYR